MRFTFRKRKETKTLCIVHRDMDGKSFDDVYRYFIQRGELGTGYHYFIDNFGQISEDRKLDEIAGWDYPNNETSIYVLVDCKDGNSNDSQQYAVNKLISQIQDTYEDILVVNL